MARVRLGLGAVLKMAACCVVAAALSIAAREAVERNGHIGMLPPKCPFRDGQRFLKQRFGLSKAPGCTVEISEVVKLDGDVRMLTAKLLPIELPESGDRHGG